MKKNKLGIFGGKKHISVYELPSTTGSWITMKKTPSNVTFSALKKYTLVHAPFFYGQKKDNGCL